MTFGPNGDSSTLRGVRSPWASPAAWIAVSPAATPTANASAWGPESEPCRATCSCRDDPVTYSVTR